MTGPFDDFAIIKRQAEAHKRDAEALKKQISGIDPPKPMDYSMLRSEEARAADKVRDAVHSSVLTAEQAAKGILDAMADFADTLPPGQQSGIEFAPGGRAIRVTHVGARGKFLVSFHGETEDGDPAVLIQHVNRLDVMVVALKQRDQDKPRPKIGFLQEPDPQQS